MYIDVSYWAFIGTIILIILTWQDYRKNNIIDDRKNYLMMGVTISLISHISRPIWYLFFLLVLVIVFNTLLKKNKTLASGDISALSWIVYGFGIIYILNLAWFLVVFGLATLIYQSAKIYIFKYKKPTPYYGVILICFVFTSWITGVF